MLPVGLASAYILVEWILPLLPRGECMFWKFWGIYCPGCGGTRALKALVHGEILLAAWYHPMLLYLIIMYAWYMISHTLEKLHVPRIRGMLFEPWIMYGCLVVLVLNCVVKNVLKFGYGIVM